jgi:hypothetical protein
MKSADTRFELHALNSVLLELQAAGLLANQSDPRELDFRSGSGENENAG